MNIKIKRKNNRAVFVVMLLGAIAGLFASSILQSPAIKAQALAEDSSEIVDVRFTSE